MEKLAVDFDELVQFAQLEDTIHIGRDTDPGSRVALHLCEKYLGAKVAYWSAGAVWRKDEKRFLELVKDRRPILWGIYHVPPELPLKEPGIMITKNVVFRNPFLKIYSIGWSYGEHDIHSYAELAARVIGEITGRKPPHNREEAELMVGSIVDDEEPHVSPYLEELLEEWGGERKLNTCSYMPLRSSIFDNPHVSYGTKPEELYAPSEALDKLVGNDEASTLDKLIEAGVPEEHIFLPTINGKTPIDLHFQLTYSLRRSSSPLRLSPIRPNLLLSFLERSIRLGDDLFSILKKLEEGKGGKLYWEGKILNILWWRLKDISTYAFDLPLTFHTSSWLIGCPKSSLLVMRETETGRTYFRIFAKGENLHAGAVAQIAATIPYRNYSRGIGSGNAFKSVMRRRHPCVPHIVVLFALKSILNPMGPVEGCRLAWYKCITTGIPQLVVWRGKRGDILYSLSVPPFYSIPPRLCKGESRKRSRTYIEGFLSEEQGYEDFINECLSTYPNIEIHNFATEKGDEI